MIAPRRALLCFAAALAGALAYVVYATPLNCNDFLAHVFLFETRPFSRTFAKYFIEHQWYSSDWRPLQYVGAHALYLAARGYEHLVFKGMLAVCVLLTAWLFVRLTSVRSWRDAIAAMIALMILLAHQSFAGAVEAVYPFGVEIILVMCELVVLGLLLQERPSRWSGISAFAISLFAILLNEKGGLVGVTYAVGALLRLPGGSRHAAVAVFLGYVTVVALRVGYYTGVGGLLGRSVAQTPADMAFDAIAAPLNILISDPRYGRFRTFPQAFAGHPWAIVTAASSLAMLLVIVAWAVRTFDRKRISTELKVAALLPVVLAGSMMFGAFSQKDYIAIMALPLYAITSFHAMRWLFDRPFLPALLAVGIVLFAGWGVRTAGLFYYMHRMAYNFYEEWATDAERLGHVDEFDRAMAMPILERLRAQATSSPVTYPDELLPKLLVEYLRGRGCPEFCGNYD